MVALAIVVLLGFLGLGVDMGYLRYQKRRMQTAADAAAIAGGAEILYSDITSAAKAASAANNFADGTNGVIVTVNHGPAGGPHAGDTNYVEVIVSQNQPTFFMKALNINSVPLSARAVAFGSSPDCIFALGNSGDAISLSLSIVTSRCGVIDDANLGGFFALLQATSIGLVGTDDGFLVGTNPTAATHIPAASDPFATLAAPAIGSCTAHPTQTVITTTMAISPGTYCGGIKVQPGANVTFNPGLYVLNGGGLNVVGGVVQGTGVTIYNTGSGAGSCTTCYGSVMTQFTSGSSLSAPTTGTYAGILFFQDRSNTQPANFNVDLSFGTRTLKGAYYFPAATVGFHFDFGNTASYTILVAKQVQFFLAFTFNANYSELPGGSSPIKNTGVLVE